MNTLQKTENILIKTEVQEEHDEICHTCFPNHSGI